MTIFPNQTTPGIDLGHRITRELAPRCECPRRAQPIQPGNGSDPRENHDFKAIAGESKSAIGSLVDGRQAPEIFAEVLAHGASQENVRIDPLGAEFAPRAGVLSRRGDASPDAESAEPGSPAPFPLRPTPWRAGRSCDRGLVLPHATAPADAGDGDVHGAQGDPATCPRLHVETAAAASVTESQIREAARRERLVIELAALTAAGHSQNKAARALGESAACLSRYRRAYAAGGFAGLIPAASSGRRRLVTFTPDEEARLQSLYLRTNLNADGGSATLAARLFAEEHEVLAAALARRKSKHSLPAAVRDAVQRTRALTEVHRQGDRGLRNATYAPGRMRMAPDGSRRLIAGEQQSWDDGTINLGVHVPWPWGGDACSDRYGVRVGRFQLLLCHDDASSFVPSWTFVVRPAQSYRGPETAGAILRAARDCGVPDRVVIEGGVWQGKRVMAALDAMGIAWIDAKGRPNQKLVENYFNRLWTRLSVEPGQVGRYRGEMREEAINYQACQAGRRDPRRHFPSLEEVITALERAIAWLNTESIESREYGTWIPQVRWEQDFAESPRRMLGGDMLWLAAPVCEERTVTRGLAACTAEGPFGMPTRWHFAHPELWRFDRQRVRMYFDPLGPAPVRAMIVLAQDWAGVRAGSVICEAESIDPLTDGAPSDNAREINRALRACMRREYRALMPDSRTGHQRVERRESEARGLGRFSQMETDAGGDMTNGTNRTNSPAAPRPARGLEPVETAAPPNDEEIAERLRRAEEEFREREGFY